MESWGRKKRSVNNETNNDEDAMKISQEILVLDFGDENNRDFLRSDPSTDFSKGEHSHTRQTNNFSMRFLFYQHEFNLTFFLFLVSIPNLIR